MRVFNKKKKEEPKAEEPKPAEAAQQPELEVMFFEQLIANNLTVLMHKVDALDAKLDKVLVLASGD